MHLKLLTAAVCLALAPAMTLAMGCQGREHQTQSCAPGTVWDAEQQTCIQQATS